MALIGVISLIKRLFDRIKIRLTSKLSVQMMLSFMGILTVFVIIGIIVLNSVIEYLFSKKAEETVVTQLEQCEYSLVRFYNEVDMLSRRIIINNRLDNFGNWDSRSETEKSLIKTSLIREFQSLMATYDYIASIIYYNSNGLAVICNDYHERYVYEESDQMVGSFYQTDFAALKQNKILQLLFFGGFTDEDFGFGLKSNLINNDIPDLSYISAARDTFSYNYIGRIIINIYEKDFMSLYNTLPSSFNGNNYLTDSTGLIISCTDDTQINQSLQYFSSLKGDSGSIYYRDDFSRQRYIVVYYKLKYSMGIIVDEIPVSELMKEASTLRLILILVFGLCIVLAYPAIVFWIRRFMRPMKTLVESIQQVGYGDIGMTLTEIPKNEVGLIFDKFNQMSLSLKDLFIRNEQIQIEKRMMEMEVLRAQINPHFLYNTLNTIKWLAIINGSNNIAECITTLSDFLEPIYKKQDILCPLGEEIEYINNYVKLMNYRYAGGFSFIVKISDEMMQCEVLRFILQPIIENSITHGFKTVQSGMIELTAEIVSNDLVIMVHDDGNGINPEKLKELVNDINHPQNENITGIGLVNVARRIALHYGEKYGLSISSVEGEGTYARVILPYRNEKRI